MAKVDTTVSATISAPRRPFYRWLVPGVFSTELETVLRDAAGLPGVSRTSGTTGPWDVPGSTRIVHLTDGTSVRETVRAANAPDYFAYRLTEFSSPVIRRLVNEAGGQWWFVDEGSSTRARWTYTAESKNFLAALILFPVIKILWNLYMSAAMKRTKERAEREVAGMQR